MSTALVIAALVLALQDQPLDALIAVLAALTFAVLRLREGPLRREWHAARARESSILFDGRRDTE